MLTHFFLFIQFFVAKNCLIHTRWKFTPPDSEVRHDLSRESVRSVQRFSRNWQHTILFSQFSHRSHRRCLLALKTKMPQLDLNRRNFLLQKQASVPKSFWRAWYEKRSLMLEREKGKVGREKSVHDWKHLLNELLGLLLAAVTQRHSPQFLCF